MSADYEIGYGKPPSGTRFRKGQSGNPKGRPKGSRNLRSLAENELNQRIVIREGGVERRICKGEALIKAQCNKAIKGDTRAAEFVHKLLDAAIAGPGQIPTERPLTAEEEEILQHLLAGGLREPTKDDEGGSQ